MVTPNDKPFNEPMLDQYKCHKVVRAGIITMRDKAVVNGEYVMLVKGAGFEQRIVETPQFVARGMPSEGDYYVIYEDGYTSWSPKKAFEEGYSKIE